MKVALRSAAAMLSILVFTGALAGCSTTTKDNAPDTVKQQSTPTPAKPVTIKIFSNFTPVETGQADKDFLAAVEKNNNVKLEFEVPPSSSFNERQQIMLAGGVYPDVIYFNSQTDKVFSDAMNNGIIIPLTKYINEAPNIQKYSYKASFDVLRTKNNEVYGIPRTSINRNDGYAIRKDWLDNVGLSLPADGSWTLDEFTEVLKRFALNDPDQNGKKDTYGISTYAGGDGLIKPFAGSIAAAFGVMGWQKSSGKYEYMDPMYSREQDNFKKLMEYEAKLYKDGLIDPNAPVLKQAAATDKVKQGVYGIWNAFAGSFWGDANTIKGLNPKAEVTYFYGIKDKNGKVQGAVASTGMWGFWTITKTAKDPQTIVKVFDWMLSDSGWETVKYGVENSTYKVQDNKKVPTEEYKNYAWGKSFVRRNNDAEFFIPLDMSADQAQKSKAWIDQCIKNAVLTSDLGYRPPSASKPEFLDSQKKAYQVMAKILIGEAPASEYDKALDEWYKNGLEDYIKEMNEYIKSVSTK